MAALARRPDAGDRYELAGPGVLTHQEIVELVLRAQHRHRRIVHVPTPIVSRTLRVVEALMKSKAPATWDEAELMEVSLLSERGDRRRRAPRRAPAPHGGGPGCAVGPCSRSPLWASARADRQRRRRRRGRSSAARPRRSWCVVMENKERGARSSAAPARRYLNAARAPLRHAPAQLRDPPPVAAQLPRARQRLDAGDHERLHRLPRRRAQPRRPARRRSASRGRSYMEGLPKPCSHGRARRALRQEARPVHVLLTPSRATRGAAGAWSLRRAGAATCAAGRCRHSRSSSPDLCHDTHDCSVGRPATASCRCSCRGCCAGSARAATSC